MMKNTSRGTAAGIALRKRQNRNLAKVAWNGIVATFLCVAFEISEFKKVATPIVGGMLQRFENPDRYIALKGVLFVFLIAILFVLV